jgi:hypothetical protein
MNRSTSLGSSPVTNGSPTPATASIHALRLPSSCCALTYVMTARLPAATAVAIQRRVASIGPSSR